MKRRWVHLYSLGAGLCDLATGSLLLASPRFTLGLMGIAGVPDETVYLRFVGVFVGGVGLAYLWPLLQASARRDRLLRAVLEITALLRLAVAVFVAVAVASGALEGAWSSVFFTDLTLAAAQIALLATWRGREVGDGR